MRRRVVAQIMAVKASRDEHVMFQLHQAEKSVTAAPPELDDPAFLSKRLSESRDH
jgi:hypothetical protein